MQRCLFSTFFSLLVLQAAAQVEVRFSIDTTNLKVTDPVYLAGNINNWNPASSKYRFEKNGLLTLTIPKGELLEYKFTRGSWNNVECRKDGSDISNHVFRGNADTAIVVSIEAWKDAFPVLPRKHTASVNVVLLDSAFYIPQLNRKRAIHVYLPPGYNNSNKRYPVLYMQDGQNCFDEFTANFGEWHIDEALDHFYDSCKKSMIVVAVDNGLDHRMQEYNPYEFEKYGKGEGHKYVQFLAQTLKPYIDKKFRTLKDKKHTHIAGSSMGGIISMWAMLSYPKVYGNAGIFSPAFWTSRAMYDTAKKSVPHINESSFFFYAGGKEGDTMVPYTEEMFQLLRPVNTIHAKLVIDENAQHNEAAWSKWFPVYLQWIMQ